MRANRFELSRTYGGAWVLSMTLAPESVKDAQRLIDGQKDRPYEVTIHEYRERRTLTANAYFHALCGKMAAVLRSDIESVKKHLVCSYGVVAERDGTPVTITLPKGELADDYYPYCVWIGGDANGDSYELMKQTHIMDSREFGRLLDMTIEECRELGIETLPDEEVKRLYAQIDKGLRDTPRS